MTRHTLPIMALALLLSACHAERTAQDLRGRPRIFVSTFENLPASCTPGWQAIITDAPSKTSCSDGFGSSVVLCICNADGLSYSAVSTLPANKKEGLPMWLFLAGFVTALVLCFLLAIFHQMGRQAERKGQIPVTARDAVAKRKDLN